jgi:1-deoxy-D-xylulose-5-phosphate synthase
MLSAGLAQPGPSVVRYPRGEPGLSKIKKPFSPVEIGKAETIREGRDGVVWALGEMVGVAEKAADLLSSGGMEFGVVNARFVKPLDSQCLVLAAQAGKKIVTLSEDTLSGGFGSAVWESLNDAGLGAAVLLRLGIPDQFILQGPIPRLREYCGLTPEAVAKRVEKEYKRWISKIQ